MLKTPVILLSAAIGLSGCVADKTSSQEKQLISAGFVRHPANSPSRRAELQLMPQHVFLTHTTPEGLRYIYADRDLCHCAFVGTLEAFEKYAAAQPHGVPTTPAPNSGNRPTTDPNTTSSALGQTPATSSGPAKKNP
jgi:hypothetical protein